MARKPSKEKPAKVKKAAPKKTAKSNKKPKPKAKPKSKPKPKKKNGRPLGATNVFTKAKKAGIISSLKLGLSYTEAASMNGVSETGLREARRADEKFSAQCKAARVFSKANSLKVIGKSDDPTVHLRHLEYLRRCADGGEKHIHEHTGKDGGAIKTDAVVTRLDVAGIPLSKLKDARKKLRDSLLEEKKLIDKGTAK